MKEGTASWAEGLSEKGWDRKWDKERGHKRKKRTGICREMEKEAAGKEEARKKEGEEAGEREVRTRGLTEITKRPVVGRSKVSG